MESTGGSLSIHDCPSQCASLCDESTHTSLDDDPQIEQGLAMY